MAQTQEQQQAVENMYVATLVNGQTYFFGNHRFDANVPSLVTEFEAQHLQEAHTLAAILDPNEGVQPLKKPRFVIDVAPAAMIAAAREAERTVLLPSKVRVRTRTRHPVAESPVVVTD